jgi:hypothetical protein
MFENRMMRKILGPERDGVTGEWRRLHLEELYDLYCSPNFRKFKSRRMSCAVHVALTAGRRGTARVLVGKPEGKRPFRKPRFRWEEKFKFMFKNWEGDAWDWIWFSTGRGGGRLYRGADKSLAQPTSQCNLFDGENISFDASLVIYIYIYN